MTASMAALRSLLPAALLALFALRCGSFAGGAAWPWGPVGQALLLLSALAGLAAAADPLRLGAAGRLLALALLVSVAASIAASPVPRAGRVALALLPACALVAAAAARGLEPAAARRLGLAAWSAVVAAVGAVGLADAWRSESHRAALPLGHHNLLGAWLVVVLPVALLSLRERGAPRWLAGAALALGGGALLATRSLSALAAALIVALAASPRLGRARHLVAGLALLGAGLAVPRLAAILAGGDASWAARRVYAEAAVAGWAERPLLGWGAGSTPWRLAEFLRPLPGVNPPGELVGETHSLPLALVFEIGAAGLALATALLAVFAWRRLRERAAARDRALLEAGLLGLAGGALCGLGDAWLAVPALPVALALAAGAALAGGAAQTRRSRPGAAVAALLLAAGALALVRPALAMREWAMAVRAPDRAATASALARARDLDPSFPLYAARWSWLAEAPAGERARAALGAAEAAGAVAPLWLRASAVAWEAGDRAGARHALRRALALDPLSGAAPFLLFATSEGTAIDCAARALAAEPRLAGAALWRTFPAARRQARLRLGRWPGIAQGWRAAFARALRDDDPARWGNGQEVDLAVEVDVTPALASSLFLFRREPLPGDVARIRLVRSATRRFSLPPAAEMVSTSAAAFPLDRCAPPDLLAPPAPPAGEPLFRDGFETGDPRRWRIGEEPGAP
jgi:hypothetical protein